MGEKVCKKVGEKVGEKTGEKVGEKTGETGGESLGEIYKLNLYHIFDSIWCQNGQSVKTPNKILWPPL